MAVVAFATKQGMFSVVEDAARMARGAASTTTRPKSERPCAEIVCCFALCVCTPPLLWDNKLSENTTHIHNESD